MDQQTKIAQEASRKRDQLREELVTVYVRLIGKATYGSLASAKDTCCHLIRCVWWADTGFRGPPCHASFHQSAGGGRQQRSASHLRADGTLRVSREVEHLLENYDDYDSPENAVDDLNGTKDASMKDANEEPPKTDPAPGELDAANGDPEDRKCIRAALEQGVDRYI
eukprot:591321-Amphidinium_carterae.2